MTVVEIYPETRTARGLPRMEMLSKELSHITADTELMKGTMWTFSHGREGTARETSDHSVYRGSLKGHFSCTDS